MAYKYVFEKVSSSLKKPTQITTVNDVNTIENYEALTDKPRPFPTKHVMTLLTNPEVAKGACFEISSMNPLKEKVILHKDMDEDELEEKLTLLRSITEDDIDQAYSGF